MKKIIIIINIILSYLLGLIAFCYYLYLELAPKVGMSEMDRMVLLFITAIFGYLGSFLLSKHLLTRKPLKIYLVLIFILYIINLLYLTLFASDYGRSGFSFFIWNEESLNIYLSKINIIPFKTIILYIARMDRVSFINILGNLIAFAPMGFFLPLLFKKAKQPKTFLLITLRIILSIEIVQLITLLGSFDIDDLILNLLSAFLIYKLCQIKKMNHLINKMLLLELTD